MLITHHGNNQAIPCLAMLFIKHVLHSACSPVPGSRPIWGIAPLCLPSPLSFNELDEVTLCCRMLRSNDLRVSFVIQHYLYSISLLRVICEVWISLRLIWIWLITTRFVLNVSELSSQVVTRKPGKSCLRNGVERSDWNSIIVDR